MEKYIRLNEIRADEAPTIDDIIDLAMRNYDLTSERQLARKLDVGATSLNNWRKGKNWPSDVTMERLAIMANVRPEDALILLNYWRTPECTKSHFALALHRMGAISETQDLNVYNRELYDTGVITQECPRADPLDVALSKLPSIQKLRAFSSAALFVILLGGLLAPTDGTAGEQSDFATGRLIDYATIRRRFIRSIACALHLIKTLIFDRSTVAA